MGPVNAASLRVGAVRLRRTEPVAGGPEPLGGSGLKGLMRDVEDGARVILLPGAALAEADDATLARALIARDPRAPRVLWHRFAPMVFRMLRRTLGADHDLND